jgi:hypothetical protein
MNVFEFYLCHCQRLTQEAASEPTLPPFHVRPYYKLGPLALVPFGIPLTFWAPGVVLFIAHDYLLAPPARQRHAPAKIPLSALATGNHTAERTGQTKGHIHGETEALDETRNA